MVEIDPDKKANKANRASKKANEEQLIIGNPLLPLPHCMPNLQDNSIFRGLFDFCYAFCKSLTFF
jgi:hypothetical protein